MTEEQLNRFFDGITAHNKEILDREKDQIKQTEDCLELNVIKDGNKVSIRSLMKYYPEDSSFNDCGSKSDSDIFFKKINDSGIEPELMDYLKEYLTETELKERLTEDNFVSNIIVPEFIEKYLRRKKIKEIQSIINGKEQALDKLKSFFKKFKEGKTYGPKTIPNPCTLHESMVEHIEREAYDFDWDEFLKENK